MQSSRARFDCILCPKKKFDCICGCFITINLYYIETNLYVQYKTFYKLVK